MLSDFVMVALVVHNTEYGYNGKDKMVQWMTRRVIVNIMMIILVMMIKGIYKGDVIGNYCRTSDS